jgi:hypothetical protein
VELIKFCFSFTAARHKSRFVFTFSENQESNNAVAHAALNLFIRSRNYLQLLNDTKLQQIKYINIEVARILQTSSHKLVFKLFKDIAVPNNENGGEYVQLDITKLVAEWFRSTDKSHAIAIKIMPTNADTQLPHKIAVFDVDDVEKVRTVQL